DYRRHVEADRRPIGIVTTKQLARLISWINSRISVETAGRPARGRDFQAAVLRHLVLARLWRAGISSCQNSAAERGSLSTASTANQSPRVQSLPMPCEIRGIQLRERGSQGTASTANQSPRVQSLPMPCGKGPLSAGLSRLSWAGEPGRE